MGDTRKSLRRSKADVRRKPSEIKTDIQPVKQAGALIASPSAPPIWVVQAHDSLHSSEAPMREAAARRLRDRSTDISFYAPFFAGTLSVVLRKDDVPRVRFVAAQAIGALGAPAGTPYGEALAAALQNDTNAQVREAAAKGLGMVGGHLDELRTVALDDGFPDVRRQAAEALGCSGRAASQQVEAWVDTLATHSFHVMRCRAASALGDAGGEASGPYTVALARATLTDSSAGVRLEAARALAKLGDAAAAPGITQLTSSLQEGAPQRRKLAARALAAIGEALEDGAVPAKMAEAWTSERRKPLNTDLSEEVSPERRLTRKTSGIPDSGKKVASSGDVSLPEDMFSSLSDSDISPKRKAKRKGRAKFLEDSDGAVLESPSAADDVLVSPPASEVLTQAALKAALHDSDAYVRHSASQAVRAFGAAGAAGPGNIDAALKAMVSTALHADCPESRSRASEALGNMGDMRNTHAQVLVASLVDDVDPIRQQRAAEALRDVGTPTRKHRKEIAATLQRSQSEGVCRAAARALSMEELRPIGAFGKRSVTHRKERKLSKTLHLGAEVAALQLKSRCATPPMLSPHVMLSRRARMPLEFSLTQVKGAVSEGEHYDVPSW
mmetsp:Transcript_64051/g.111625  ORF Transcript_64051/g.111625 Transcript_64051/m.111625 type:complete len:612 (-) Transcript_64051:81-1916(-)